MRQSGYLVRLIFCQAWPRRAGPRDAACKSMGWRSGLTALSLAIPLMMGGAGQAAPRELAAHAETYTFAFHDADISQVAEAILGQALNVPYTVDPSITGKMSFRIDQRLTGVQLLEAFEAALESADIVMVREGESLNLKPRAKAKEAASLGTLKDGLHGAGYETVAVPVQYAAPSEVAKALQAISTKDLVVYVDDKQGLLILGGTTSELESAVQMVKLVDHSGLEDAKIRFFELEQAPANTVAEDLQRVLEASHVSGVTIVPLKRLNGLFVFGRTTQSVDEVGRWIAKLDTPSKERTTSLWVYHPRNVSAEALANTLNGVSSSGAASGATPSSQAQFAQSQLGQSGGGMGQAGGGFPSATNASFGSAPSPATNQSSVSYSNLGGAQGGSFLSTPDDPVHVAVDRESNTLLFSASQARWIQIQRILGEIDHAPGQVLIEASILEVTLTDQFKMGVDWSFASKNAPVTIASNYGAGAIAASTPGFAITYLTKDIQVAVNALKGKTAVEVVSAPKIIALDNHPAQLQVGDQVPVISQTSQSTSAAGAPVINSVNYQSTGVILNVTPRISGDNRIVLDISQQVSSVAETTTSGIDSPTIQQRSLSTTLILDNGGVVALGGMISSSKSKSDTGLPYLKDAPFIGNFFKNKSDNGDRTELIVLITAKIINDAASSQRVMADLLADMKEIKSRGLLAQ